MSHACDTCRFPDNRSMPRISHGASQSRRRWRRLCCEHEAPSRTVPPDRHVNAFSRASQRLESPTSRVCGSVRNHWNVSLRYIGNADRIGIDGDSKCGDIDAVSVNAVWKDNAWIVNRVNQQSGAKKENRCVNARKHCMHSPDSWRQHIASSTISTCLHRMIGRIQFSEGTRAQRLLCHCRGKRCASSCRTSWSAQFGARICSRRPHTHARTLLKLAERTHARARRGQVLYRKFRVQLAKDWTRLHKTERSHSREVLRIQYTRNARQVRPQDAIRTWERHLDVNYSG